MSCSVELRMKKFHNLRADFNSVKSQDSQDEA